MLFDLCFYSLAPLVWLALTLLCAGGSYQSRNWPSDSSSYWNLEMLVLRYPEKHLLEQGERTNNTFNPHMVPGPGIKPRTHWWEVRALASVSSSLSKRKVCPVKLKSGLLTEHSGQARKTTS